MKHFNALTELENEVLRLDEMRKLMAVLVNGLDSSRPDEIESSFHYIEGSIADISKNMLDKFQNLFGEIANDSE